MHGEDQANKHLSAVQNVNTVPREVLRTMMEPRAASLEVALLDDLRLRSSALYDDPSVS